MCYNSGDPLLTYFSISCNKMGIERVTLRLEQKYDFDN